MAQPQRRAGSVVPCARAVARARGLFRSDQAVHSRAGHRECAFLRTLSQEDFEAGRFCALLRTIPLDSTLWVRRIARNRGSPNGTRLSVPRNAQNVAPSSQNESPSSQNEPPLAIAAAWTPRNARPVGELHEWIPIRWRRDLHGVSSPLGGAISVSAWLSRQKRGLGHHRSPTCANQGFTRRTR